MINITTVNQMVRIATTKEIQEISERRYQKNILIDKDGSIKEGIKDAIGESRRHAYVATVYEYWARIMGIKPCYFIEDRVDYDCDVMSKHLKTEIKTKKIDWKKVRGFYSQKIDPDWSILIPKRNYDQKPNIWVFGGCYTNYKVVELFGWLTDKEYRRVRQSYLKGEVKNQLPLDENNWDVNFADMYPMSELINLFSIQQPKQVLDFTKLENKPQYDPPSIKDLELGDINAESIYANL